MGQAVSVRDLQRRKFQVVAANVLNGHADTLKNHDERLNIVTTGIADLTETVTANAEALRAVAVQSASAYVITSQRGFWGRLRWLFTGR